MLWVILADGAYDQTCTTKQDADKERRDLRKMGFDVRIKPVKDWDEAYKCEEKYR